MQRQGSIGAALLACALLACDSSVARPPSVLFLTVDTLRPDYMSMNGYDRATTPVLDSLIAGGFYFEQAVAPVPRTTPALASLLTGAYPHTTGVRTLTDRLAGEVVPLAEVMAHSGYQTVAVVTNQVLARRDLDRGFTVYDVAGDIRSAQRTSDAALRWVESLDPAGPVFAWVHYIDPHTPYHSDPTIARRFDPHYHGPYRFQFGATGRPDAPAGSHHFFPKDLPKSEATHRNSLPEPVNAHIRRLYAADIRAFDAEIGRVVEAFQQRWKDLIIVFTADHGESLGEHDFYFDHGDYVYNASTRVPLAVVLPESHPLHGTGHCDGWVSLVDVVPTLFELLGRDVPDRMADQLEGRSLASCMRGESLSPASVFAESGRSYFPELVRRRVHNDVPGRFRAVVQGDFKLIHTPFADDAWELYDVASDPHETRNLYSPDHPAVADLQTALEAWLARAPEDARPRHLLPEDEAALRELGYIE